VHLLRGNHETPQLNGFFGYRPQIDSLYGLQSPVVNTMNMVFKELPLMMNLKSDNKSFLMCHGGCPVVSDFNTMEDLLNADLVKQLEPSDPIS